MRDPRRFQIHSSFLWKKIHDHLAHMSAVLLTSPVERSILREVDVDWGFSMLRHVHRSRQFRLLVAGFGYQRSTQTSFVIFGLPFQFRSQRHPRSEEGEN